MGYICIWDGSSNLQLVEDAQRTLKGPYRRGASLAFGCVVWRFVASSRTRSSLWKVCDSVVGPFFCISCAASSSVAVTSFCTCSRYLIHSLTLCSLVWRYSGGLKVGWNPYQTSKGDLCMLRWGQTLCANLMIGSRATQLSCWKFPHIWRYCSISWFTHSDSPSVCGWKAIESFCLIPSFLQSSWVTCAANCGPRSDMIVKGKPVHFHTLFMRSWLVCSAVMVALQGDKMIALLWRSMTVRILSYPCDTGSPTMKSIVMVSQTPLGTSFGLRGTLTGGRILVVWQVAHPLMYSLTNSVMPGYQYSLVINSSVFHSPGWPMILSWNCCTTLRFRLSFFGMYTSPLWRMRPFL